MKILSLNQPKLRSKMTLVTALFLLLTVSIMTLPYLNAQTESSPIPTYAYLTLSPNPVGVDQQVTLVMWIVPTNPAAGGNGASTLWTDFTLLITKPDS